MELSDQPPSTIKNPGKDPIRQFVIYAENKVGWLIGYTSPATAKVIQERMSIINGWGRKMVSLHHMM